MKAAFVTGATSYMGGLLVRRLLGDGILVHVAVRPTSDLSRLPSDLGKDCVHVLDGGAPGFSEILGEAQTDTVYHIAGAYARDHGPADIDRLIEANITLGTHLLDGMVSAGVKNMVCVGSAFQHFHSDGYRPFNLYAATKQAFVDIAEFYSDIEAVAVMSITPPDVYGPGDWRPKLMNHLADACVTDRSIDLVNKSLGMALIFADDAVDALVTAGWALASGDDEYADGSFSIDAEGHYTLEQIVRAFENVSGRKIRANWDAYKLPPRQITKPWKGPALPNWRARVSLDAGIERLLDHLREAGKS